MSAIEWCECCLSEAPIWSAAEYGEWVVLLARDGEYLGVVCAGCVADEELLLAELEQVVSQPDGRHLRAGGPGRVRRRGSKARQRAVRSVARLSA